MKVDETVNKRYIYIYTSYNFTIDAHTLNDTLKWVFWEDKIISSYIKETPSNLFDTIESI